MCCRFNFVWFAGENCVACKCTVARRGRRHFSCGGVFDVGEGASRPSAIEKDRSLRGIDLVNLWFPLEIFLMNQTVGAAKVNLNVFYLSIIFHVNIFPG